MEPSPTAEAHRLTELYLTSPATKIPGTLVSSRYGSRSSFHDLGDWVFRSGPARMKPLASTAISLGSQSVLGAAPMKMNRELTGRASSPRGVFRVRHSRWPLPDMAMTSVQVSTVILGVALIWSMRYLDMLLLSESARTSMWTSPA